MDIWYCINHQEVLLAWNRYRKDKCNVISFDYHTDTHGAFIEYANYSAPSYEEDPDLAIHTQIRTELWNNYFENKMTLQQVVFLLLNDEHIDFAMWSNIINKFFIIPLREVNSASSIYVLDRKTKYKHERIIEYDKRNSSCVDYNDKDYDLKIAEKVLDDSFLQHPIDCLKSIEPHFFDNYILDIDLDYFRLLSAISPEKYNVFSSLVKNARAITIALEPRYCISMDINNPFDYKDAFAEVKKLIKLIIPAKYKKIPIPRNYEPIHTVSNREGSYDFYAFNSQIHLKSPLDMIFEREGVTPISIAGEKQILFFVCPARSKTPCGVLMGTISDCGDFDIAIDSHYQNQKIGKFLLSLYIEHYEQYFSEYRVTATSPPSKATLNQLGFKSTGGDEFFRKPFGKIKSEALVMLRRRWS